MVFEERLEYLKKLIKQQDEIKNDAVDLVNQHLGLVNTYKEMNKISEEARDLQKIEDNNKNLSITEKGEENDIKMKNENEKKKLQLLNYHLQMLI